MPKFNGTGPLGYGPGTGRGLGPCGGGMRQGRRFYTKKEESELLKKESETLAEELKAIKERLTELEDQK